MKEDLKLDFMDMKTLVINKLNEEIVLVYIKKDDGETAIQMSINGELTKTPIRPILLAYAEYVDLEVDGKKLNTHQLFCEIYKMKYNSEIVK